MNTTPEPKPEPQLEPQLVPGPEADDDGDLFEDFTDDPDQDEMVRSHSPVLDDGAEDDGDVVPPLYPNVYSFVGDYLITVWARPIRDNQGTTRWCSVWWKHPEAVARLDALWHAFEALRLDPDLGAATWWRDFADPTMRVLMDPAGPFAACGPTTHQPPPILGVEPPPGLLEHG